MVRSNAGEDGIKGDAVVEVKAGDLKKTNEKTDAGEKRGESHGPLGFGTEEETETGGKPVVERRFRGDFAGDFVLQQPVAAQKDIHHIPNLLGLCSFEEIAGGRDAERDKQGEQQCERDDAAHVVERSVEDGVRS